MHRSAVHVMTASNIIDLDLDLTHLSTDTIILGHFDVIMLDPLLALLTDVIHRYCHVM